MVNEERSSSSESTAAMTHGAVEFLIAVHNEDENALARTLDTAHCQTLSGRIVLIDDASSAPIEVLASSVEVVRLAVNTGISGARNEGLRRLHSPVFVGVYNCDVLLPEDWARTTIDYLSAHLSCGAVWTGLRHADTSVAARWWLDCQELKPPTAVGPSDFAPGHAVMFRKAALDAVDGYDAAHFRNINEDHDICRRMWQFGIETHYIGDPVVTSLQDVSMRTMARKDIARMQIGDAPVGTQVARIVTKAVRRIGRHLLAGQIAFVPRDVAVGAHAIAYACLRGIERLKVVTT